MKRHWIPTWTMLAVLTAFALTAVALTGGGRPAPLSPGATEAPPARTALGPFRLGLEVRNRAHLTLRLEFGQGRPQTLDVVGDWATTPSEIHDGIVEVACGLSNVEVRLDADLGTGAGNAGGAAQQRAARELAVALSAPFFVSYRADGSIAGLWLARDVNPTIANVLMTLAGTEQLVRGRPGEPAWVGVERDVNGQYTAAYRERAPGRFEKQKASYLAASPIANAGAGQLASVAGPRIQPAIRIERSDFELRADAQGRVLEVQGEERITFELGSPGLAMTTSATVELDDARTRLAAPAIGAFARARAGLEARPLEQMGGDPRAETGRRDRAALGGASFEDLRAALDRLPGDVAPDAAALRSLQRRFEALFRLDRAAAARAPGLVRDDTPARSKIVVDALSLARTTASQAALAAIAGDAAAPVRPRGSAIQYLAQQDAPPGDVVNAVAALLDDRAPDLRQMARLTYGAFARSLRPTAPDRSRRIIDDLLARLARATTAAERSELVVAIGNAGAVAALPVLRRVAESGTARERAQAVEALRFVDDPSVDSFLIELLRASSDVPVRLAVIGAVRFREVGPFARVLADVAQHDPTASIRSAALSVLGDRMTTLRTLQPVLEDIRNRDGAASNRELAARYLDRAERAGSMPRPRSNEVAPGPPRGR